jgi:hypothetical protein
MIEQLSLQGFEQRHITGFSHPAFNRRRTDQLHGDRRHLDIPVPARYSTQVPDYTPLISVFTLGRFSLLLNGKPADFGRKVPRRPLEMLKMIVALGGREISTTSLISALWPDADGDVAQRSFDTTLHR